MLFDRSWYNRAGVERVMGFCTQQEYLEFMRQAPEFERMLVHSGMHLFKFWFSVSRAEQRRRFKEREIHPLKQWKLSPIDMASLDKWDDYTKAKEAMFFYTDTADAPWTVIKSDCKKRARLNAMRYLLHKLALSEQGPRAHRPARPADRRPRARRLRARREGERAAAVSAAPAAAPPLDRAAVAALRVQATRFGAGTAAAKARALAAAARRAIVDAPTLLAYHDALLFLLAYPETPALRDAAARELARVAGTTRRLMQQGPAAARRALENSGLAWTEWTIDFGFDIARWLVDRFPAHAALHSFAADGAPARSLLARALLPLEFELAAAGSARTLPRSSPGARRCSGDAAALAGRCPAAACPPTMRCATGCGRPCTPT